MEEIFEIRSCIEILPNDIKIDTTDSICSTVNKELQDINIGGSHLLKGMSGLNM